MKVYITDSRLVFGTYEIPSAHTYGADALLEQIAMHVEIDTLGSRQIYIK